MDNILLSSEIIQPTEAAGNHPYLLLAPKREDPSFLILPLNRYLFLKE